MRKLIRRKQPQHQGKHGHLPPIYTGNNSDEEENAGFRNLAKSMDIRTKDELSQEHITVKEDVEHVNETAPNEETKPDVSPEEMNEI